MSVIHRNLTVLFILLLVGGYAWLYGGTMSSVLRPVVPWIWVFMLEIALCFPQRHDGEPSRRARRRVWEAMREDPLVWVSLAFVLLMCIPFVNSALCPVCDAKAIAQGADPGPAVPFLPYCVDRLLHYNVFLWFAPTLTAAIVAKHSLVRSGKRLLIEMLVWNGAALALLGFVQQVAGAPGPLWSVLSNGPVHFFSTFGYPNMAGDYFVVMFCLSIAQWRWRMDDVRDGLRSKTISRTMSSHETFWRKHYLLIAALLNFFAALNTLSRAAIILVASAAVILFAHAGFVAIARMEKVDRVRSGVFCALGLIMIAVAATMFMPDGVHREMKTVGSREVLDRVTGRGEEHSFVATQIWREHLLFGCGGWGYAHLSKEKFPDRKYWSPGSANVHNDHLQFLVEHGLVGYGLLVAAFVLLLIPTFKAWHTMADAGRFALKKRNRTQTFFALPGSAFSVLVAAVVPLVHGFGDCPLRSPAVLSVFFVSLACIGGYLPRESSHDDSSKE